MLLDAELKIIIKKYALTQEELYRYNDLLLITITGIRKIIATEKLNISKRVELTENRCAVVCRVEKGSAFNSEYLFIEEVGECSTQNSLSKYPVCTANNRATSRAVLLFLNLYGSIIGAEEIDEFVEGEELKTKREKQVGSATDNLIGKITKKKDATA